LGETKLVTAKAARVAPDLPQTIEAKAKQQLTGKNTKKTYYKLKQDQRRISEEEATLSFAIYRFFFDRLSERALNIFRKTRHFCQKC